MKAESDSTQDRARLRALPSVDRLLPGFSDAVDVHGHPAVVAALRDVIGDLRERIVAGNEPATDEASIRDAALVILQADATPRFRRVFNLTGTVLHTNLGRAVLPEQAIEAIRSVAAGYSNLEFDLDTGRRGDRESLVQQRLCELTGAEAATVVNNNAAAVLLVLNTLAMNREVPVSRGELVEIGGSFRIPEIMQRANCTLVEVGATNRTHLADYRAAINERTALLLKVHTSNYRIEGFTKEVAIDELASLAAESRLPLVMDLGSGSLIDFSRYGLPAEPTVAATLSKGVDVVTFSGDKLLGGPQSGVIAGKADLIDRINANPLKRALRLDKMTLAGISAVLDLYRNPDKLGDALPTLQFLTRSKDSLRRQAERIAPRLAECLGEDFAVEIVDCASQVGSGSLPTETIPSIAIGIRAANGEDATRTLAAAFRKLPLPVVGHAHKGTLQFDLRCLDDEDEFIAQLESLQV